MSENGQSLDSVFRGSNVYCDRRRLLATLADGQALCSLLEEREVDLTKIYCWLELHALDIQRHDITPLRRTLYNNLSSLTALEIAAQLRRLIELSFQFSIGQARADDIRSGTLDWNWLQALGV